MVQPRKTRPFITERLLIGRKESNQTNKKQISFLVYLDGKISEKFIFVKIVEALVVVLAWCAWPRGTMAINRFQRSLSLLYLLFIS